MNNDIIFDKSCKCTKRYVRSGSKENKSLKLFIENDNMARMMTTCLMLERRVIYYSKIITNIINTMGEKNSTFKISRCFPRSDTIY